MATVDTTDLQRQVHDLIEHYDRVTREDLVSELTNRNGVTEQRANDVLDELERTGSIYIVPVKGYELEVRKP